MSDDLLDAQPPAEKFILECVPELDGCATKDPEPPNPIDDPFDEFWRAYPRKAGKKYARSGYRKAVDEGADPDAILAAAQAFHEFCVDTVREKEFIRHPARWLSERPWEAGQPYVNRPRRVRPKPDLVAEEVSSPTAADAVPEPIKRTPVISRPVSPKWTLAPIPTAVYRLLSKDNVLLYVGVSGNVGVRLKTHEREKPWWFLVEHTDIRTESAYGDFFVDEYEACLNEFPVFNVDLVPWRCWRPSTGNKAFDRIRDRADIAGAVARLDDAGVRGRLDALRKAFRATYETAVAVVGPDVRPDETWRRLVLIAAEERYLDFERKPPRERGAKRKSVPTGGVSR